MVYKNDPSFNKKDIFFMKKALKEAEKAFKKNEVPIGAVIVNKDDDIISKAHNLVESKYSQLAHAEIIAIEKACKKRRQWRLEDCVIYVTLEPCAMCMNYIMLSRLNKIIFGAGSPKFGYRLDKNFPISVYRKEAVRIFGGVCEEESVDLLKAFFVERRL